MNDFSRAALNRLLFLFAAMLLFYANTAYAGNKGIDSDVGLDLPISSGGTPAMKVGAGQSVPAGDVEFLNSVGIGTASPQAKLDVKGEVRIGNSGVSCSTANEGAQRYNYTTHTMEFCNGSSWNGLGGYGNFEVINAANNATYTRSYTGRILVEYHGNAMQGGLDWLRANYYFNGASVYALNQVVNYVLGAQTTWYQEETVNGSFNVGISLYPDWGSSQIIIHYL